MSFNRQTLRDRCVARLYLYAKGLKFCILPSIDRSLDTIVSITLAVVVAQLVEWSLPTPEVRGLNPVIGNLLYRTFVFCQLR